MTTTKLPEELVNLADEIVAAGEKIGDIRVRISPRLAALRAATAAWEYANELVCEGCGSTQDETAPINGWCNDGNYCADNVKITRAEFLRRKEGR